MKFRLFKEMRENGLFLVVLAAVMMIFVYAPDELAPLRSTVLFLCLAVGASFFGAVPLAREFTDGSAAMLLTQPVSRSQIWLEKWSVSFGCWMILAAIFWMFAPSIYSQDPQIGSGFARTTIALILMMFLVGPCMAMIGRNVLVAFLLTFGLPVLACLLLVLLSFITDGLIPVVATGASFILLSVGMLVGSYLLFLRCEDKPSLMNASFRLPLPRSDPPRPQVSPTRAPVHGPIHALVLKEFRLIRTILVFDAALALLITLVPWLGQLQRATTDAMGGMWFIFQIMVVPVLLGVASIMGDRLPGVLEHQMTAPVSMGAQWAVKLLVGLLTTFVILVPLTAVPYVMLSGHNPEPWASMWGTVLSVGAILAVWIIAMYAASLCRSTVRALCCAFVFVYGSASLAIYGVQVSLLFPSRGDSFAPMIAVAAMPWIVLAVTLVAGVRCSYSNVRFMRTPREIGLQLGGLVAGLVIFVKAFVLITRGAY